MESRLGSDIMGWVESHICTRVPFHPWQRLNTVTLQYKGGHKFGKAFRSALSRPDHSSYFLTLCLTQHTRAAHSQARHNIISSMPSNISGAIRQTFTQGVVYGDVMAIGKWLSSPGIIARHHYWHIAHCNTSQWTHQPGARRQARPLPLVWATFWWCQCHDSWLMTLAPCLLRITLSTPITTWHSDGQTGWLAVTSTFINKIYSYLSFLWCL